MPPAVTAPILARSSGKRLNDFPFAATGFARSVSLADARGVVRPFSASASRANFSVTSVQIRDSTPVNGRNDSPQNGVPQRPQPKEKPQNHEQLRYQFA